MELYQHDTQVLSMNLVYIKYRSVDDLPHPVDVDHIDMIKTFGGNKTNRYLKKAEALSLIEILCSDWWIS